MDKSSVDQFIKDATITWNVEFNCLGLLEETIQSSALERNINLMLMLVFVLRLTMLAKLDWAINKSCAMELLCCCLLLLMERISMLEVTKLVLHWNWKLKLLFNNKL